MKKLCLISILTLMIFSGCSANDITINKVNKNVDSKHTATPEASDELSNKETNEVKTFPTEPNNNSETYNTRLKIGDRFPADTMVDSGEFYVTINSAQIFHNLNDSGIKTDETLPYSLLIDDEPRIEDAVEIFDIASGDMLNGWGIVKLNITVENINGISSVPDPVGEFDDDVFTAGFFSVCNVDNSDMINRYNYKTCRVIYFSLAGEINNEPLLYTCHNGETVEYDIAYIFNCKAENLAFSISSGSKTMTMVDLDLTE